MKKKSFKFLAISGLALLSANSFADLKLNDAIKLTPTFQSVRILKEKKAYFLQVISTTVITENGQTSQYGKTGPNYQELTRRIKMPVNISVERTGGFGNKIQFLGFGDDDVKTGSFKNLNNLRIGDLLTSYEGTSTNIGLTFIGGGYTTMTSQTGATLKEGNGSITMIGPAGTPIGINAGLEYTTFTLNIASALKAVQVDYDLKNRGDIARRMLDEKVTKVESLDEVSQFDLTSAD